MGTLEEIDNLREERRQQYLREQEQRENEEKARIKKLVEEKEAELKAKKKVLAATVRSYKGHFISERASP
jgi:hypothetical protein